MEPDTNTPLSAELQGTEPSPAVVYRHICYGRAGFLRNRGIARQRRTGSLTAWAGQRITPHAASGMQLTLR